MKYGNCLLYALWQKIIHGGRIELDWMSIKLMLPRFWHISRDGVKTRFAPANPKHGCCALLDKLCYRGSVKTHKNREVD